MVNPRSKGRRGEIKVRDILAAWYGSPFTRTPGSGAWGTIQKRGELTGDLSCDDPLFPWSVEVKNREGWTLDQLLTSKNPPILSWWAQTLEQAAASKKLPMLVIMRNRATPFVVLDLYQTVRPPNEYMQFVQSTHTSLVIFPITELSQINPKDYNDPEAHQDNRVSKRVRSRRSSASGSGPTKRR